MSLPGFVALRGYERARRQSLLLFQIAQHMRSFTESVVGAPPKVSYWLLGSTRSGQSWAKQVTLRASVLTGQSRRSQLASTGIGYCKIESRDQGGW